MANILESGNEKNGFARIENVVSGLNLVEIGFFHQEQ